MADITRTLFLRHLRGAPTAWIRHASGGGVRHAGVGISFWFRARTAVVSEVPVDDRDLSLVCHARTADHAELSVPLGITYRIAAPELAATRLDFGIEPRTGRWRGAPLDALATLLGELAQQPALAGLAGQTLSGALAAGPDPIERAVTARLADDSRLAELGVQVAGVRVLDVRPTPEMERALATPTREAAQAEADRATYQRRADAVERERAIAENELQSKIELARREQQLIEQRGANARRRAETDAAAALVAAEAEAQRGELEARSNAERDRTLSAARAAGVEELGRAQAAAEAARSEALRDLPSATLALLAARELAGKLPEIGQLTITPDVVTGLLERLRS